jgi:uncharacterized protein GlcG (DUF336 family)
VETTGQADKLTHVNYAFANVSSEGRCFEVNAPGLGDAWADYQHTTAAADAVYGVGDTWGQPLAGNFPQLKKLKAKHPGLKVLMSIGGYTWGGRDPHRLEAAVVDEGGHLQALGRMNGAAPLSAQIAEAKAASVALFRRDGAALRQMQEATPAFFAQLDRAVRVPILAGAGAALILRGDTVLGAGAVSGGMVPGQDDECAEAGLTVLAPYAGQTELNATRR